MNLKEYLFYKSMSAAEFGRLADLSGAYISHILKGKSSPTAKTLRVIEKTTNGLVTPETAFAPTKLPPELEDDQEEGDDIAAKFRNVA